MPVYLDEKAVLQAVKSFVVPCKIYTADIEDPKRTVVHDDVMDVMKVKLPLELPLELALLPSSLSRPALTGPITQCPIHNAPRSLSV